MPLIISLLLAASRCFSLLLAVIPLFIGGFFAEKRPKLQYLDRPTPEIATNSGRAPTGAWAAMRRHGSGASGTPGCKSAASSQPGIADAMALPKTGTFERRRNSLLNRENTLL
jgi:hypothetical protein